MKGKYLLHSAYLPEVDENLCKLCETCIENCGYNAIKKDKNSIYFIAENCVGCGVDKFKALYKDIDWKRQLDYGRQMGIGNQEYEIINLP